MSRILIVLLPLLASRLEAQAPPVDRLGPGQAMPFHVVDFVGGARSSGAGCPSVMINNERSRGVEIWTRSNTRAAFQWAAAVEEKLGAEAKLLAFLVVCDGSTKANLPVPDEVKRFVVGVPRNSPRRRFATADAEGSHALIVFLMDGKTIKSRLRFQPDELTPETRTKTVQQVIQFLDGPAPGE